MKIIAIFIVLSESVFALVSKKLWSSENLFNETINQTNISYRDQTNISYGDPTNISYGNQTNISYGDPTNISYGDQTNGSYGESIAEIEVLPPTDPPSTNWANESLDYKLANETRTLGAEKGPNKGIYAFIILPILLLACK
jgi:hypothetical protein